MWRRISSPTCRWSDGQRLEGDGWALTALHTPGHAPDHLCFALEGTKILFSGDHVMGWSTSVVGPPEGNMGDFIRSLQRLTERSDELYFPGHGGQVEEPQRLVKAYLLHRRMREQSILECIRAGQQHGARDRADHLQGPGPEAPQRSVSFCPRPR